MSIFRRTADIFAASLNDLVDRFEEPQQMLRHAVREIEALLTVTSTAVARSIAAEKLLAKARTEQAEHVERWHQRAAEALADGDEPLARRAIERKLEHQRATAEIDRQLAEAHEANNALRRQLDTLRDRHATARAKLMTLSAQHAATHAQQKALSFAAPGGQARALARFKRFYEQLEFAQAETAALIEIEMHEELALESEFDRRETERAVDAELAHLIGSRKTTD